MIQKLALHFDKPLKGAFNLGELNFLFAFQVNCPGCFIYGIPAVNSLIAEFGSCISFLGLSTAFEDFEYNNPENTRLLLEQRVLVGETKKYFSKQGYTTYPMDLQFPVAMDTYAGEDFDLREAAIRICETNPNYAHWPKFEQAQLQKNVMDYLKAQPEISLTFTLNQMRGTPSFIVFNHDMEILSHQFGHQSVGELKRMLQDLLLESN